MNEDSKMTLIENISNICSNFRSMVTRLETLKSKAFELSIKDNEIEALRGQKLTSFSEHLNYLNLGVEEMVNSVTTCEEFIDLCFKDLTRTLFWLPEKKNQLEVQYVEGNSPWSFWVTYQDSTELECLQKTLGEKHQEGALKPLESVPDIGSFVCCHERKLFFRGLVLGVVPEMRLKIMGVDTKCIKIAKLENVYEITQDLCRFHANAVHCCLTEDEYLKELWNEELSEVFKSTLRECSLTMNVINELECFPPKFHVELIGTDKSTKSCGNLSDWVCQRLLPELSKLSQRGDASKEEDLFDLLSEEALDPYLAVENNRKPASRVEERLKETTKNERKAEKPTTEPTQTKEIKSVLKGGATEFVPSSAIGQPLYQQSSYPPRNPAPSSNYFYKNSGLLTVAPGNYPQQYQQYSYPHPFHQQTQYRHNGSVYQSGKWYDPTYGQGNPAANYQLPVTPMYVPAPETNNRRLQIQEILSPKQSVPTQTKDFSELAKVSTKVKTEGKLSPNSETNSSSDKENLDLKKAPPEETCKKGKVENLKEAHSVTVKNVSADDPAHEQALAEEEEPEESPLEQQIINEEEACLSASYHPTDETRICQFFAKRGYCWKMGCSKEHTDPAMRNKWTTDQVFSYSESYNLLLLPNIGDNVTLHVTHVISPNSFFCWLPMSQSDTGEFADGETIATLNKALNDPNNIKSYEFLDSDPCLAEVLLVLCKDSLWRRARVSDVNDNSVVVFYLDYGMTESLPNSRKCLRKIPPEFLHLPFQAALCFLAEVCVSDDILMRDKGLVYLESLILDKEVEGKVVQRVDSELHFVLWASGININDAMVDKGFCSKI